jgi:hypothetical protein
LTKVLATGCALEIFACITSNFTIFTADDTIFFLLFDLKTTKHQKKKAEIGMHDYLFIPSSTGITVVGEVFSLHSSYNGTCYQIGSRRHAMEVIKVWYPESTEEGSNMVNINQESTEE